MKVYLEVLFSSEQRGSLWGLAMTRLSRKTVVKRRAPQHLKSPVDLGFSMRGTSWDPKMEVSNEESKKKWMN